MMRPPRLSPTRWRLAILAVGLMAPLGAPASGAETPSRSGAVCQYEYSVWNTHARQSVALIQVRKPRAALTPAEVDASGCTPCRDDQIQIRLANGVQFLACRLVAEPIRAALAAALRAGQPIGHVVGYRPQMSRGPVDRRGNRTRLSNHSFGTAIDINEDHNGLYDECPVWNPRCRLIKGGPWDPAHPLSISPDSPLVRAMRAHGWRWGGAIAGRQKDFMHFSPSGY